MEHLAAITQDEANSLRKKEVAGQLMFCGIFLALFYLVTILQQIIAWKCNFFE